MPKLHGPLVAALIYDGLCTFEFGIAAEIFGLSRPEMGSGWYRFVSCPIEDGPLGANGGLTIQCTANSDILEDAEIIIIPGWKGVDEPVPEALCTRLRAAHARGARLASICSGAFVLAATGLLDGGVATTHWRYADALRQRFPNVEVDDASLYRSHDRIFTSAGSAAGMDLLIEMVRQDFGSAAANKVARRLVIPAHRKGGQAQFLERPVRLRDGTEVAPLLDKMRQNLASRWTVATMARECRMSNRTFLRRFTEATGNAPGEWLANERVEMAKQMLCDGHANVEEIATLVGLGSAYTLRHQFRRKLGISPSEYRARFMSERQTVREG